MDLSFSYNKNIIRDTYRNFKYNSRSVIYFEILYKLLTMFIIMPLISFVLKTSMSDMGVYNITNTNIIKYGLTSDGMVYMTIVLTISFLAMFVETGILTYMAYGSHNRRRTTLTEGMINIFSICPRYPSLYMLSLILISGIAGPLTGIGLYNSMITKFSVPSFIKIELFRTFFGKVLYVAAIIGLIILLLRWILAIPIMVIEDVTLKEAFVKSKKVYVENRMKLLCALGVWMVLNYVIRYSILGIVVLVTTIGIGVFEANSVVSFMIMTGGIVIFFVSYVAISVITLPLFITYLVELYYSIRDYKCKERIFVDISFYDDKKYYSWIMKNNKRIMTVIIVIFIIVSSNLGISAIFNNVVDRKVAVSAHRGGSEEAPENSISALKAAINDNADYVELDVRTTKDGEVVVFHDSTLKRITGSGKAIGDMTLSELQTVDIGSKYGDEFKGERIPTFDEFLKTAKGKIKLNVELKTGGSYEDLPSKTLEIIKKNGMEDQVVISSQDYDALQAIKQEEPLIPVGYILTFGIGDFTKLNVDFISMEYGMLKKSLVYAFHGLDKEVHVWTVNDTEKAENAIKLGADNIITDSPKMVKSVDEKIRYQGDINYMTRFVDSIYAIMRYINI